ncbi:MAG: HEAT repeat domain-containing protein, partial [Planctomycetota bacterium]
ARARALEDLASSSAHLRCLGAAAAGGLRLEEAVPELARLVRKDDPATSAAIASLGMIGGERAAKALGSALPRARETPLKIRIIRSLGRTRARSALKPLLRAFDDGSALVRAEAATALGALGMREAAGALRGAHAKKDLPATVRIAAASALARLGDPEGLAALERAVASGSPELGVVAIRGLAALVYLPTQRQPASRASPPASDERLRLRAVECVAAALGSPYAEVWSEALGAIAFLRPPGALRVLDALERRASPRVRLRAKLAKAAFGGHGSRRTLEGALLGADPHLRAASCAILGSSGDGTAVEPLSRALDDPRVSVRVAAARALGAIGGERAKQELGKAATREDAALEVACRRALGRIRWHERREGKAGKPVATRTPGASRSPAGQKRPAAQEKPTGSEDVTADPRGYRLSRILTGAGGKPLCMIRRPDGRTVLLGEGEDAGRGYVVERIVPRRGGGRVFLVRGDTVVTLDVEAEPK